MNYELIKTNYNSYLYSHFRKEFIVLPEIFAKIINNETINKKNTHPLTSIYFSDEEKYYRDKFSLLKKNNYFKQIDLDNRIIKKYNHEDIKTFFANTQQILFEVTDICDLSCTYCAYGELYDFYEKRDNKKQKFLNAKRLIDLFLANSTRSHSQVQVVVIGFYGGEPLLNFKLIKDIVNYLNSLNIKRKRFLFTITTNGVSLGKYRKFLIKNNFHINISLDGNEINNSYRLFKNGKSSFEKVFQNIKLIQTEAPKYFDENVTFSTVLHNKNNYEDIYNFFKKNFNKVPFISPLSEAGLNDKMRWKFDKIKNKNVYSNKDINNIFANSKFENPINNKIYWMLSNLTNIIRQDTGTYKRTTKKTEEKKVLTGSCNPFSKKIFLTVKGKLLFCERIAHNFSCGDINENNAEIDFYAITNRTNEFYSKIYNICKNCANLLHCNTCAYRNVNKEGKFKCKDFIPQKKLKNILKNYIQQLEENEKLYNYLVQEVIVS